MDVTASDDETVEFEIEVITSSSSVSLISGDRDDFEINVSSEKSSSADAEKSAQEEVRIEQQQQVDEPYEAPIPTEIDNQDDFASDKPVAQHNLDDESSKTWTGAAESAIWTDNSTSKPESEAERQIKEEPIDIVEAALPQGSIDQETIPSEAREPPPKSIDNEQSEDYSQALEETSGVDESSEPGIDGSVCNKVLHSDLKSLQEKVVQLDLERRGTFHVIGEEVSGGEISETQYRANLDDRTLDDAHCSEARREPVPSLLEESLRGTPELEATKSALELFALEEGPRLLVSEINRCPDGWVFVDDPAELQMLSLAVSNKFTTSSAQPLGPLDAADKTEPIDASGQIRLQTDAANSNGLAANPIERLGNLSVDQEGAKSDDVAEAADEALAEPEVELVQNEMVDISVETASSPHGWDAPKAPHVIVLNESADAPGGLESATHSSISVVGQVCSHEDEYDSLSDEDEDLEREFDEEPEFEARHVVVKQNKDPRDEYILGSELGRGKFGTVVRCTEQASGRQLAAKFIAMRRREDREDVEREVAIMSVLQHRRLLQLYDAFDDGCQEMCLITELVEGGELFERIVDDDFELTEKKAAIFMRQICEGVEYMHGQQIVHLDMKPENILCLSRTGNRIKLIDFGLARRLDPNKPIRVMFGTPDFAAPEVLSYDTVTLNTDMWSVGVICYVLLSGLSPFMGESDMDTMANVTRATYDFNDQAFEPISELAKDFISKLLLRDPSDRLRPAECLKHAWLQKGGAQLEVAVRERRSSTISLMNQQLASDRGPDMTPPSASALQRHRPSFGGESTTSSGLISLDKRRLKRYVVKRKWHKTVHAIMALNRMGANLNKLAK